MNDALPRPYTVVDRRVDTADTVTLTLDPPAERLPDFAPGQFAMLTAYGVGEVPISLAGQQDGGRLVHTVRAVGAVSAALHAAAAGTVVGVRGPYGAGWDLPSAAGMDLVVVAGGIGLAPLRPVVTAALADPDSRRRLVLLAGARTPGELIYRDELAAWEKAAGTQVAVTVDRPGRDWHGHVGVVTTLLEQAFFDPQRAVAFVCGPEVMMRFAAEALGAVGVPAGRIRLSLERNMRCGAGWCGHCQLGPLLVCRDGPVVGYDVAGPLLGVREL